ncbi:MAG: gamma-glutamyl-gamma-aminobutyrate hydrolase family protein [Terriglobales bacterium]
MHPRVAIPFPHSNQEYAQRVLPPYQKAVEAAGGEPVIVPIDASPEEVAKIISRCDAVLLPGSKADVDPQKYGATRHAETADPDPLRDAADELLIQDAYNMRKPILGICYGLQSLNVWRTGTLVQDIASELHSAIKHDAGRKVPRAHNVTVEGGSRLAGILGAEKTLTVNSSHHQAADVVGDGLRVAARCPDDGVIEALESTLPGQWVVAVQWHPERSYDDDAASRTLFRALIEAAAEHKRQ